MNRPMVSRASVRLLPSLSIRIGGSVGQKPTFPPEPHNHAGSGYSIPVHDDADIPAAHVREFAQQLPQHQYATVVARQAQLHGIGLILHHSSGNPASAQAELRAATASPTSTDDLGAVRHRREQVLSRVAQTERALEEAARVLGPLPDLGSVAVSGAA